MFRWTSSQGVALGGREYGPFGAPVVAPTLQADNNPVLRYGAGKSYALRGEDVTPTEQSAPSSRCWATKRVGFTDRGTSCRANGAVRQ